MESRVNEANEMNRQLNVLAEAGLLK